MNVYVGLEGFLLKRMYIIKEMTVLYENDNMEHYLFAAPELLNLTSAEATTVRYASQHLNGLSLHDGEIPYKELFAIISKLAGKPIS